MTELEIGRELNTLGGGNVAVGNEDHVGDGTTREDSAADELTDEVDTTMLVCDGHDDAVRDEEYGANGEREKESVPGKMNGVAAKGKLTRLHGDGQKPSGDYLLFNNEYTNSRHGSRDKQVPTKRSIFISSHQTTMDIFSARDARGIGNGG